MSSHALRAAADDLYEALSDKTARDTLAGHSN
jgi:hypothetical protein